MQTVLKVNGISKSYGKKRVLDSVSITVRKGDVYGFVGRNGAGKTTLMRIISGLAAADGGEYELFRVNGKDKKINEARRKTCTMIESPAVYPYLSAYDNLKVQCYITRRPKDRISELLSFVNLSETGGKKAGDFSLGMRQRLGIAIALVSEPELMLLDEPVNGLDPEGIKSLRDLLLRLREKRNVTIVISSHILTELSLFATRYGFIDNGKILKEVGAREIYESAASGCRIESDDNDKAFTVLKSLGYRHEINGESVFLDTDVDLMKVCAAFKKEKIRLTGHFRNGTDLESYFLRLVYKEKETRL